MLNYKNSRKAILSTLIALAYALTPPKRGGEDACLLTNCKWKQEELKNIQRYLSHIWTSNSVIKTMHSDMDIKFMFIFNPY